VQHAASPAFDHRTSALRLRIPCLVPVHFSGEFRAAHNPVILQPLKALLGPALYTGIVGFGITMAFLIHAPAIGWASIFIFLPLIALTLHTLTRSECYGDANGVARHLEDFPFNRKAFASPPTRSQRLIGRTHATLSTRQR
jgi:hypothetical protein